jgi:hypothetical protein
MVRYLGDVAYYEKKKIFFNTVKPATLLSREKLAPRVFDKCMESTYYRFHKYRRGINNQITK